MKFEKISTYMSLYRVVQKRIQSSIFGIT